MAKGLPALVSKLAPDLRRFLDRVREILEGNDPIVTQQDLVSAGTHSVGVNGRLSAVVDLASCSTPPPPQNLTALGAMTSIQLSWTGMEYGSTGCHVLTQIWRSDTDSFGTAVMVGTTNGTMYTDAVGSDAQHYYWVRFLNANNELGPLNATAGTLGTTAPDIPYVMDMLTGNFGNQPYFYSDGTVVVNGVTIPEGTWIKTAYLHEASVQSAHIGTAVVDSAHIAALAVDEGHINNGAVTNLKIGDLIQSADGTTWSINKQGGIDARSLTVRKPDGTVILSSGGQYAPEISNAAITTGGGNLVKNSLFNPPTESWSALNETTALNCTKTYRQDGVWNIEGGVGEIAQHNDLGDPAVDYAETYSEYFAVEPGAYYEVSARAASHRCKVSVYLVFLREAGHADQSWKPAVGGSFHADSVTTADAKTGGPNIADYKHLYAKGQAPAEARRGFIIVRKWATDNGEISSFGFFTQLMACRTRATQSVPTQWPGGLAGATIGEDLAGAFDQASWDTVMGGAYIKAAHIQSLSADAITAGTLTGRTVRTSSIGSGQHRVELNASSNQAEFYDSTGTLVGSIGISVEGSDTIVADLGDLSLSVVPLYARSNTLAAYFRSQAADAVRMDAVSASKVALVLDNLSSVQGSPTLRLRTSAVVGYPLGWTSSGSPAWKPPAGGGVGDIVVDASHKRLFYCGSPSAIFREFLIGDGGDQAPTGYLRFSNGFQICWGTDTRSASAPFNLTYANTFTSLYAILALSVSGGAPVMASFYTNSQVTIPVTGGGAWTTNYIAIGYAA